MNTVIDFLCAVVNFMIPIILLYFVVDIAPLLMRIFKKDIDSKKTKE